MQGSLLGHVKIEAAANQVKNKSRRCSFVDIEFFFFFAFNNHSFSQDFLAAMDAPMKGAAANGAANEEDEEFVLDPEDLKGKKMRDLKEKVKWMFALWNDNCCDLFLDAHNMCFVAVGGKRKQLDEDVDMVDKNKTPKPQFPAISPGKLTVHEFIEIMLFLLTPVFSMEDQR